MPDSVKNTDIKLIMSPAPHVSDTDTVPKIMFGVVIALIPTLLASLYFFRLQAFRLVAITVGACVLTEWAFQKLRGKPITLYDGSAIVTGLLLAFNLPPTLPSWMAAVGGVVAMGLGKHVFGGLGHNPFNPALIGRAFLLASFPAAMIRWTSPIDGMSTVTPLVQLQMGRITATYWDLFIGNIGGCIGETSALAILIGGLYLLYKRYIDWRIPVSYLGTVAVIALAFGQDPIFHWLAGGLMLGAFFMATDMVTTPITRRGKWLFGIGAGIVLMVIRQWGSYPEGVTYSILLMNAFTPLLDHITRPRPYGEVRAHA
ncbi:MAG: RnfABCDGE type electron transport complex subunit D [Firmicutes bacterium]|jgi:electron transport complex protein RnfD|nr:RnfABCDGE type electron transport complex subunit D [Bacillota bacterium]